MRERLLGFVDALRAEGVVPSVGESMDAVRAVAAAGVERPALREALAATLVKDHADRGAFDALFDRYFAAPGRRRDSGRRMQATEEGAGAGSGEGVGRGRAPREGDGRGGEEKSREAKRGEEERASRAVRRKRRRALC